MRQKIDYGIDLGTTNSAIAKMDFGSPIIIKSDDGQSDTTPSCVFRKHSGGKSVIYVGGAAKRAYEEFLFKKLEKRLNNNGEINSNGYMEFKREIGSDKVYDSVIEGKAYSDTPTELSSYVLRRLREYVRDEEVNAVVITVPMKFGQSQVEATREAGYLAGFQHVELFQEPIAASLAYGIKKKVVDGYWLVFDLGGGTFDAVLMKIDEGIMSVIDTEGDNHLGGKDIDNAIVDHFFVPEIQKVCDIDSLISPISRNDSVRDALQNCLKIWAEKAKIELSTKTKWEDNLDNLEEMIRDYSGNNSIELFIKFSLEQYNEICMPIFQKAIDICKKLLCRNQVNSTDLSSLILVGGPTLSGTLRSMLKEQLTDRIDTSIDPMTAVAVGAAISASTKDMPANLQQRDQKKVPLTLKYPTTTVEIEEQIGFRVERQGFLEYLPESLLIEVNRLDRGWSSGKISMNGDAGIIEVRLNAGKANQFEIRLFDESGKIFHCEPAVVTIIQGIKVADAVLPFSIGLNIFNRKEGKDGVSKICGLEKNKRLPAKGTEKYTTLNDMRQGNSDDKIKIQFYELETNADGSRAILNPHHGGFVITGKDLSDFLPSGSDVEIRLEIDSSRKNTVTVYIPALDETIERYFESEPDSVENPEELSEYLKQAQALLEKVKLVEGSGTLEFEKTLQEISLLLTKRGNDYDVRLKARKELREVFISLEKFGVSGELFEARAKLDGAMKDLLERVKNSNKTEVSPAILEEYEIRSRRTKDEGDIQSIKNLTAEIIRFSVSILTKEVGFWASFVKQMNRDFEKIEWTERVAARKALDHAQSIIANNPTASEMEGAVRAVWLLEEADNNEDDQEGYVRNLLCK